MVFVRVEYEYNVFTMGHVHGVCFVKNDHVHNEYRRRQKRQMLHDVPNNESINKMKNL